MAAIFMHLEVCLIALVVNYAEFSAQDKVFM